MTDMRRRQILDAAGAVIAERGIAESRIADIAGRIGVSPALILYYFESKDRLLGEALAHKEREFFDGAARATDAEAGPPQRLAALIEASCPCGGDAPADEDYVLWIEAWSRSRHDKHVAAARHNMDARWRRTIADVVEAGQAAGDFTPDADPVRFALKLSALIDGLAIQVVLGDDDVGPDEMRRVCFETAAADLGCRLA